MLRVKSDKREKIEKKKKEKIFSLKVLENKRIFFLRALLRNFTKHDCSF